MQKSDAIVQCFGKEAFSTRRGAEKVVKRMRHARVRSYRCEFCEKFHIGSRMKGR